MAFSLLTEIGLPPDRILHDDPGHVWDIVSRMEAVAGFLFDDPDAELVGLEETGGRLLDFDLTTAMMARKTLTVHIEDGRRLDIIPRDAKNFEGTGPFRK